MRRKLTASIGFYSHVLLDFHSWICKLKLCSRVMATFTYSEGCSSESCVVSSVHTNFLFNLWLSLAPKRLLFVSYKSKKEQYSQALQCQKQPFVNFNLLHNIVRMRTQSYVWKSNFFFCTLILVILVSHNAYHIHNSFLWNINARLTMPLPCNSFFYRLSMLLPYTSSITLRS